MEVSKTGTNKCKKIFKNLENRLHTVHIYVTMLLQVRESSLLNIILKLRFELWHIF